MSVLRKLSILMAAAVVVVGCSSTGTATGNPTSSVPSTTAATPAPTGLLAQIKAAGTIKVALAVDPPFALQNPDGTWHSMVPSLLDLMAKDLGVKTEIVPTTFQNIVAGLQANTYDMIGASLSATPKRMEVIDFASPFSYGGTYWLVKKDNTKTLTTLADLNNKDVTIAANAGSAEEEKTKRLMPLAQVRSIPGNMATLLSEISSGRSDALAVFSFLVPSLLAQHPEFKAVPAWDPTQGALPDGVEAVGVAWAVNKGNQDLLDYLNGFIKAQTDNGTINKLSAQFLTLENMQ